MCSTTEQSRVTPSVLRQLHQLEEENDKLKCLFADLSLDNAMDRWAYEGGMAIKPSRSGKPTDNAVVANFNERPYQECRSEFRFMSREVAQRKIEA